MAARARRCTPSLERITPFRAAHSCLIVLLTGFATHSFAMAKLAHRERGRATSSSRLKKAANPVFDVGFIACGRDRAVSLRPSKVPCPSVDEDEFAVVPGKSGSASDTREDLLSATANTEYRHG